MAVSCKDVMRVRLPGRREMIGSALSYCALVYFLKFTLTSFKMKCHPRFNHETMAAIRICFAVPALAWTGPEGSKSLRVPASVTTVTRRW
jgi:hypothetical protein